MDHETHRLALGCMGLGGDWNKSFDTNHVKQAQVAIETALEAGISFFDHADIYSRGKAESVFGEVLKSKSELREKIVLQSKCGIHLPGDPPESKQGRYNLSYSHILNAVDGSLKRLHVENLDFLLLHRNDPLIEPEEVARAFEKLKESGKVSNFGVSNHTPAQMTLLQKYIPMSICANQIKFNLLQCNLLDGGNDGTLFPQRNTRGSDGTIEFCRLHNIRLQAWSPVAKGVFSGRSLKGKDNDLNMRIEACTSKVKELSEIYSVSREAVAVAWILHHPARILPILGSKTPQRIKNCAEALNVRLSREEWYELYCLGRGSPLL